MARARRRGAAALLAALALAVARAVPIEAQDGAAPGAAALLLNELGLELPADDD